MTPEAAENRNYAIQLAREILSEKEQYVILETETTGLDRHDVVLWLTLMDLEGNLLLDELLKLPKGKRIHPQAKEKHGVDRSLLKNAKEVEDVMVEVETACTGRTVLAYNAKFHLRLLIQTVQEHGLSGSIKIKANCVMEMYKLFEDRHYVKLPGKDNTGEGDCLAVLKLINKMAEAELEVVPEKPIPSIKEPSPPVYTSSFRKKSRWTFVENKTINGCLIGLAILGILVSGSFLLAFLSALF